MTHLVFEDDEEVTVDIKNAYAKLLKLEVFINKELGCEHSIGPYMDGWVVNDVKAFSNPDVGYKDAFNMFSCLLYCNTYNSYSAYVFKANLSDNYYAFFAPSAKDLISRFKDIAATAFEDFISDGVMRKR